MDDDIRLAELLCARLCHDLAGPTGAVTNGAELLEEDDPDTQREAAALMAGAATQIAHRLRFFRAAFGWEGGAARDLAEAIKIASDFLAPLPGQPARFAWVPAAGGEAPADGLRLLLLLILFASEALPRGGSLALTAQPKEMAVHAEGIGAGLGEDFAALADPTLPPPTPTPRTAPLLLALGLARRSGWRLSAQVAGQSVRLLASR